MARIIAILIAFMPALPALADYHYASHEGSNEYPYTSWATAADSIQKAIDAAEAGDTVYVGAGTFVGNLVMKDTLALIGLGWDSTVITNIIDNHNIIMGGYNSLFRGIHVSGQDPDRDIGLHLLLHYSDYAFVYNCKFSDLSKGIFGPAGGIYQNNIFDGNNIAFDLYNSSDTTIVENNTFLRNWSAIDTWYAFYEIRNNLFASSFGVAISFEETHTIYIQNNTLFNSGTSGYGHIRLHNEWTIPGYRFVCNNYFGSSIGNNRRVDGIILSSSSEVDSVINNIFTKCEYAVWSGNQNTYIGYNDFYDNSIDVYHFETGEDTLEGNIYVNPMVTDYDDGFHLQGFSPCIDAGHPDILDVDGTRSDMGAYGGPYGNSYVYQDWPPEPPDSLWATIVEDTIITEWTGATEADFNHYNVYRDTISGFEPAAENLISSPVDSFYHDIEWTHENNYYYKITSVDNQDNESEPSVELEVILTSINDDPFELLPKVTTLKQNYPNPFNPRTTIAYSIPNVGAQPAEVTLEIYNILGERIKALVNERQYPGRYRVEWDGTDNDGNEVSSGVYFYNIKLWGIALIPAKKMVILK